jgi:hypothetical protein
MSRTLLQTPTLMYLIGLSFFGLLLVGILSVYPPVRQEAFVWRKPLVGWLFCLICMLGIIAVFYPNECSRIFTSATDKKQEPSTQGTFASHGGFPTAKGHHPDCENFAPHVFRVGDHIFCTACTGLLVGGLASLVGAILYFFGEWTIPLDGSWLVWLGVLGVGCGLFQFKARRTALRLSLNIIFVVGSLVIVIGVDELIQNVFAELFVVFLVIFWLFTRISLSQWDHKRICSLCNFDTCRLVERREKKRR